MNKILKSYLLILATVIIGIGLLVLSEKIPLPHWVNSSAFLLAVFIILNIIYDAVFKLNAIQNFWSLRKVYHLLPAAVGGTIIAVLPALVALGFGSITPCDLHFNFTLTISSLILSFIIVGWEELWFRGVILNYANRHLSPVNISLTIGLLFMLVHVLNPEIELLKKGPALFFAGALLTILYFYYRSIWVPCGLHFGNNFFGGMLKAENDHDPFFGGDGYLSAIILAAIFLFFAYRIYNNRSSSSAV